MITPIDIASASIVLLLVTGFMAGLLRKKQGLLIQVSFILSSLSSFMAVVSGIWTGSGSGYTGLLPRQSFGLRARSEGFSRDAYRRILFTRF